MTGRHLIEPRDFSLEELESLFALAQEMERDPRRWAHAAKGKLLASLFLSQAPAPA